MIIDCIADLHGAYPELEGGDLLIVAGDLTCRDWSDEYERFFDYLEDQDYRKIICIAGNHDNCLERHDLFKSLSPTIQYLCDSGTEFEGLKIWGSPWTHTFPGMNPHCMAFTKPPGQLKEHWDMIPEDTDILITHGPPRGILDYVERNAPGNRVCGCADLNYHSVLKIRPKLHVFGHIHEGYGQKHQNETLFVNASLMNGDYEFVNKPIRVLL